MPPQNPPGFVCVYFCKEVSGFSASSEQDSSDGRVASCRPSRRRCASIMHWTGAQHPQGLLWALGVIRTTNIRSTKNKAYMRRSVHSMVSPLWNNTLAVLRTMDIPHYGNQTRRTRRRRFAGVTPGDAKPAPARNCRTVPYAPVHSGPRDFHFPAERRGR